MNNSYMNCQLSSFSISQKVLTWRYEPSQTSNFQDFTFLHILKGYALIYQLSKFQAVISLNFLIKADSNLIRTVLSPLEKHQSILNHAPRACAEVVSARCSHRRAYKSNTLNAYRIVINKSRSSICGRFTLRTLGKQRFEPSQRYTDSRVKRSWTLKLFT